MKDMNQGKQKWSVIEVRAVANGWVVGPREYDIRRDECRGPDQTWVFNDWAAAQKFIRERSEA